MNTTSKIIFFLSIFLLGYLIVKDSHSRDYEQIMRNEIYRAIHSATIFTMNDIQKNIPYIFKGITAKGRNIADRKYKCKLLENTSIKDDC
tara:strand:+ start:792 stop:1061 length:270 start_codon:yes stop_codon:yes gene_type:complete